MKSLSFIHRGVPLFMVSPKKCEKWSATNLDGCEGGVFGASGVADIQWKYRRVEEARQPNKNGRFAKRPFIHMRNGF